MKVEWCSVNHKVLYTVIWQQPLQSVLALRSCSATDLLLLLLIILLLLLLTTSELFMDNCGVCKIYFDCSAKQMRLDDELLNLGLIGLLECPVCMEYMGPPIHQCRRGHLVCSVCKPKLPSCPTCRSRFTESRNLAMEKVNTINIIVTLPNSYEGGKKRGGRENHRYWIQTF